MFTGIIERIGVIKKIERKSQTLKITLEANFASPIKVGESISSDGICLTVNAVTSGFFSADVSEETYRVTNLRNALLGKEVNLERALPADGRFGGHFVQGHIDCLGRVIKVVKKAGFAELSVSYPKKYDGLVSRKGSIAVDGVSLTIADKRVGGFSVAVIPETLNSTIIKDYLSGRNVNLEFDILAKYLENLIKAR